MDFEEIERDYHKLIYARILAAHIPQNFVADCYQHVFIYIMEHSYKYDPLKGKLSTWLYSQSRGGITDFRRKNKYNFQIEKISIDSVLEVDDENDASFENVLCPAGSLETDLYKTDWFDDNLRQLINTSQNPEEILMAKELNENSVAIM